MKFHFHQYWLLLSPHNPRDPSVTSKTGKEAMLSGGPCWSALLLSRLVAVHWIPVFLCLHTTPGCGTAYQGWNHGPTPTMMRLVMMMTVKPYTIHTHAVISARNVTAILELTFHLFLTTVSFSLSLLITFPFSILVHFCLYIVPGFSSLYHTIYFLELLFPRKPSCPKLNSFCGTASHSSFWNSLLYPWIQSTVSWIFSFFLIWFLILLEHALK